MRILIKTEFILPQCKPLIYIAEILTQVPLKSYYNDFHSSFLVVLPDF